MKLNKFILLTLVGAMALPYINVHADEDYAALFTISQEQTADGRLISVKIDGYPSNDAVDTLLVLPQKVDGVRVISDNTVSDSEMSKSIHADENFLKTADKVYKFYMPDDAANGVYTFIAGGNTPMGELKNRYHDFYYTSNVSDSNAFITSQTLTSAKLQEGMSSGYFYIDTNNAAYTTNRNAVAKIVDDLNPQNQFELEEAFRLACDFVDAKNMDAYMLDSYMTLRAGKLGFDTNNADYAKYPENTKRIFKNILDNASGSEEIVSLADLRHTFIEACAVSAIDMETDALTVIEKLKEYNDEVFKLDFSSASYNKVYPYDVGKEFVDSRYNSVSEIVTAFNTRVANLAQSIITPPRPAGGGGGGGSSSGGGSAGGVTVPTNTGTDNFNELTDNMAVFDDTPKSHWANVYIEFCYKNNIMTGDGKGDFRPDENITRKEFVKTILCAFGVDANDSQSDFADIDKNDWAYPYISKAYTMGVANGITDEYFAPENNITRQDAVTMLFRIVQMAREDYPFKKDTVPEFTDKSSIADYAAESIRMLYGEGVIGGYDDGTFKPEKTISRAECAKIIKVLLDAVG